LNLHLLTTISQASLPSYSGALKKFGLLNLMMFLISKKIKKSPLEKKNSKIKNINENYRKESGWVL